MPLLEDGALVELLGFLNKYNIPFKHKRSNPQSIEFPNKSVIRLGTLDVDVDRLRGPQWASICIDEAAQVEEDVWRTIAPRARNIGSSKIRVFTNSKDIGPGHWIHKDFITNKTEHHEIMTVSTYDNHFNRPEVIRDYEIMYPPGSDLHKRWMLGHIIAIEGAAFPEWNESFVCLPSDVPKLEWYGYGLDLGSIHPLVLLEGGVDSHGRLWITNEYFKDGLPLDQHIPDLKLMYQMNAPVYADHDPEAHKEMRQNGFFMHNAYKASVDKGIGFVRKMMLLKDIRVSTNCKHLIEDLYLYRGTVMPGGKEVWGHGPNHKYSHTCDALRYLVCGVEMPSLFDGMRL